MGTEYGGSARQTGDEAAARLASLIQSLPSGILVEDDERTILHVLGNIASLCLQQAQVGVQIVNG